MPLENYDCEGTLTIGGVSMNCPAWAIVGDDRGNGGLLPLWVTTLQRGADRLVPSTAGLIPYRRRETATGHDLRIIVAGDVDESSTPYADTRVGLAANLNTLESTVVQPTNTGDGTRAATLTVFGQSTRTANIHVVGLTAVEYRISETGTTPSLFVGTLEISIPAGRFT